MSQDGLISYSLTQTQKIQKRCKTVVLGIFQGFKLEQFSSNAWLNTEFITNAFTEEEQNNILECENEAQGKLLLRKSFC